MDDQVARPGDLVVARAGREQALGVLCSLVAPDAVPPVPLEPGERPALRTARGALWWPVAFVRWPTPEELAAWELGDAQGPRG